MAIFAQTLNVEKRGCAAINCLYFSSIIYPDNFLKNFIPLASRLDYNLNNLIYSEPA